jgi:hypothetical protein
MTEHETDILSDEQIDEGPAGTGDRPWRIRLATAQQFEALLIGMENVWAERNLDRSELEGLQDDPDRFVAAISEATGLEEGAVEDQLDQLSTR